MNTSTLVQKLWNYSNVLRDDRMSFGDYVEQLTYLLFLKMADERSCPPYSQPSLVLPPHARRVVATGFNIDHVLIGPAGVFTIETKTWSKPLYGDARIAYDGENLTAGKLQPDRDPVVQAKAQSRWLKLLIAESTGRRLNVQPVVLFPGWFVEAASGSQKEVWVLEPKALPALLANADHHLAAEDIKLVSFHLSRFIRSVERERVPQ